MVITHTCNSLDELSHLLIKRFIQLAKETIKKSGSFHVAFSGGRTPQLFFKLLTQPDYSDQILWGKIHLYICDERFVPLSHADSNFGVLKKILIDNIPIPADQIHFIQTEQLTAEEAALRYAQELQQHLPKDINQQPQFDFILLGIGEDGHIASLFPDTTILSVTDKIAAAVFVEKLQAFRISLTFSIINGAKQVAFIVTGRNKAPILKQIFSNTLTQPIYPVQMLKIQGQTEWYLDSAAAENLETNAHHPN